MDVMQWIRFHANHHITHSAHMTIISANNSAPHTAINTTRTTSPTHSRHRGWGCVAEVVGFEEEVDIRAKGDPLSIGQGEQVIVVQN